MITRSSVLVRPISPTCTASCPAAFRGAQTRNETFSSSKNLMLVARTSRWPGNRQVILAHGEGRVGSRLLDISCLDEREVRLDLLQRPTRSYQAQQMLNC